MCFAVLASNSVAAVSNAVGMELNHGDNLPLRRYASDMTDPDLPYQPQKGPDDMNTVLRFHQSWFYVAIGVTGLVGLWGLVLAAMKREPGQVFVWARGAAITVMLIQVGSGVYLYANDVQPGNAFHVFYGVVIAVTLTLAYVYRAAMARRPALTYGVLLFFVMGLGLRAWANVA